MSISNNIVFIALSDTHGNDLNLSSLFRGIQETMEEDRKNNPQVKHVLLVPGDVHSTSAIFSAISNGQFDIAVFEKIAGLFPEELRFFTPGNHDWLHGESLLLELIERCHFRVLASNATFKEDSQLPAEQLAQVNIDNEELTITGFMTRETFNCPYAKGKIEYIGANPAFSDSLPDIILSHLGSVTDKQLATQLPNHKRLLIVGGHTHDPQINHNGKIVVINVGSGEGFVKISAGGEQVEFVRTKEMTPHPDIEAIARAYEEKCGIELTKSSFSIASDSMKPSGLEIFDDEMASTESHLRIEDSVIMRLTADAIAARYTDKVYCLYPAAAIRTNFEPGQVVTQRELFSTYYYTNKLVRMRLTGEQLVRLLTFGILSGYQNFHNRGQLLTPSFGLQYQYDIEEKPGNTIRCVKVDGQYINMDAEFEIVTTDWVANGVKNLFPEITLTIDDTAPSIFELVSHYLEQLKEKQGHLPALREAFAERISCQQTLQEQHELTKLPENSRSAPPTFDREAVVKDADLSVHRQYYVRKVSVTEYSGVMYPAAPSLKPSLGNVTPPPSPPAP